MYVPGRAYAWVGSCSGLVSPSPKSQSQVKPAAVSTGLSGFLNRVLEGLTRLTRQGDFTKAASLTQAADDFRTAVDSAAAFVAEQCVVGPDFRIARPRLYESYKEWCPTVTRSPLSARRFNERVKSLLPDPSAAVVTVTGTEQWQGLTLASEAPPETRLEPATREPAQPPPSAPSREEGGKVEKVEEVPIPSSPGPEGNEKGLERTSTLSTSSTQDDDDHRCPGCRLPMSVARVNDVCGRCQAWGSVPREVVLNGRRA